jgi:hypothetical protein
MYRRNFLTLPILGLLGRMLPGSGSLAFADRSETAAAGKTLRLWYRQPAKDWNEALPIGNAAWPQ